MAIHVASRIRLNNGNVAGLGSVIVRGHFREALAFQERSIVLRGHGMSLGVDPARLQRPSNILCAVLIGIGLVPRVAVKFVHERVYV